MGTALPGMMPHLAEQMKPEAAGDDTGNAGETASEDG